MKKIFPAALLAVLTASWGLVRIVLPAVVVLDASPAQAYEKPLGSLVSSGATINNTTTAAPWVLPFGIKVAIQCSAASCVLACATGASCTATCSAGASNTGVQISANTLYDMPLDGTINAISQIPVSGSSTCQVFQVLP